jgi:predicted metal-binding membrane protein
MWWTMMMAMMLPTALPALLTDSAISRRFSRVHDPLRSQTALALGYATVWTTFAFAAALLNILAGKILQMTPMMAITSQVIGIVLLIIAGIYQLTPAKQACLVKCQSPIPFRPGEWRDGLSAAYRRGINHGLYCTGCCGILMVLLFYGGVMEVNWIGGLALYVLVEKLIPAHWRLHQFTGVLLILWAAYAAISLLGH